MSNIEVLERRFATIGAALIVAPGAWRGAPRIDVLDPVGFMLAFEGLGAQSEPEVIHTEAADRHLLLLIRNAGEKSKFLCGHDERHWFVAAIPESARGVMSVETAKAALQPELVAARARTLSRKRRFDRRNAAFVRQGEWFFIPEPSVRVDPWRIRRNEPLARPGGTPHVLREASRRGGEAVYVRGQRVVSAAAYAGMRRDERRHYRLMTRDPELFARGTVRHPDHATVTLRGWHRVVMNTEQGARAMRHVAFLD